MRTLSSRFGPLAKTAAAAAMALNLGACSASLSGYDANFNSGFPQNGTLRGTETGRCAATGEVHAVYYNVRGQLEGIDIVGTYNALVTCGQKPEPIGYCYMGAVTDSVPLYNSRGVYIGDRAVREGYVGAPCGFNAPAGYRHG